LPSQKRSRRRRKLVAFGLPPEIAAQVHELTGERDRVLAGLAQSEALQIRNVRRDVDERRRVVAAAFERRYDELVEAGQGAVELEAATA
jgi:hypothetical protein